MNRSLPLLRWTLAVAVALPAAAPGVAGAAPLTGQFTIDGKALPLREVAAFRIRDQGNARLLETYVVLSATPLDKGAIGAALDPYVVVINDPAVMNADSVSFSVDASGQVSMNARVGGVQYLDTSGMMMGERGSLVATCKENTAKRVACSVESPKPVQSMDGPAWSVDLAFETDVISRAAGKPLPAGGGEAGKALLALRAAVGGDDLAKLLALLTPDEAKEYQADWRSPEENFEWAKQLLDVQVPKKPKITGGETLADDHVVLEVEGEPYPGGKMLHLVEMKRIDGRWVFAASSPVGLLK